MNAEGDQRSLLWAKQLVSNDNDVLIGIVTLSAQGLAAATKGQAYCHGELSQIRSEQT